VVGAPVPTVPLLDTEAVPFAIGVGIAQDMLRGGAIGV